jgi:cephalosporin hydroxylase
VIRPRRDLLLEAARLYARIGTTLCETPAHVYLDGLHAGGAIHKDDVWALEQLLAPRLAGTVFIVGASFGFSSLVLALLLPRARVVTLDNWSEGTDVAAARAACEALSGLAEDPGPRLVFATGESPADTAATIERHGDGQPVVVALVDGLHTNAQLVADCDGLEPWLDARSMLLLHDVRLFDLWRGVRAIASRNRYDTLVQLNTATGMVVAFNRDAHPEAFAFLQQTQVVAHWHPDLADAPGSTTSYPAIGWDADADRRERRYDTNPRPVGEPASST